MLRRWLDECAGGGPRYADTPAPAHEAPPPAVAPLPLTRRQILDRYEQHTRHCPSCRRVSGRGLGGEGVQALGKLTRRCMHAFCSWHAHCLLQPLLHPAPPPQALATVQATRRVLQAGAASGFAVAFTLAAAQALLPPASLPLAGVRGMPAASLPLLLGSAALAAGAAQLLLGQLEQRFLFVDYVHPEK